MLEVIEYNGKYGLGRRIEGANLYEHIIPIGSTLSLEELRNMAMDHNLRLPNKVLQKEKLNRNHTVTIYPR